jgi:2-succinyl-5-enolpyruvyl-6-hydroxy-3-cyclohexene-1-carboxylate synthase
LWGTPHGADITALAAAHGLATHECVTVAELREALTVCGPVVIRVATNRDENVTAHDLLNRAVATVLDELAS